MRMALDYLHTDLKEKYIEFFIYYLKKFDDGSYNLDDLNYQEVNKNFNINNIYLLVFKRGRRI